MQTLPRPATLDRERLRLRYLDNRARSARLFGFVEPAAFYERPIGLRHPIVFYEGHIPAFSFSKVVREALGGAALDPVLEKLFERGIDPSDLREAARHERASWPERAQLQAFTAACDTAVLRAFAEADFSPEAGSPGFAKLQAALTILEHEEMHHETLLYMLHRLALDKKRAPGGAAAYFEREPLARGRVRVPAGQATLGAPRGALEFGWDNEFEESVVAVAAFDIDVTDVTNGDWLAFVSAGGPVPSFWLERDGTYRLLGMFEEMPLPLTWPVYVTQAQAAAYARWQGRRLPTEAEFHRAAFGAPEGERALPWGAAQPAAAHGNFGFARFDPEPVGIRAEGASAWGVHDLIGNGWEWTSSEFAPLPGFQPHPSYPQYSADFFDGAHFIVKGASPVTNLHHLRRSFRNWYRPEYPYVYATFRTVDA